MDRSRTRNPPNYKGREANKVLQQNSYQSRNNRTIQRVCGRSKILAINQKEDECLSQIIMNGGNDVLEHIDKKAKEFENIDADTALTVFFLG